MMDCAYGYIAFPRSGRQDNAAAISPFLPGNKGLGLILVRLAPIVECIVEWLPTRESVSDCVFPKPGKHTGVVIGFCSPFPVAPEKRNGELLLVLRDPFQYERSPVEIKSFVHHGNHTI